jgi:hypothetical protein
MNQIYFIEIIELMVPSIDLSETANAEYIELLSIFAHEIRLSHRERYGGCKHRECVDQHQTLFSASNSITRTEQISVHAATGTLINYFLFLSVFNIRNYLLMDWETFSHPSFNAIRVRAR